MNYKEYADRMRKEKKTKSVTPEFMKLEKKGDTFVGVLKSFDSVKSRMGTGTYNMYVFDTDNGLIKTKFGQATDKEIAGSMEPGNMYAITYEGKTPLPTGVERNTYEVLLIATFEELQSEEGPHGS